MMKQQPVRDKQTRQMIQRLQAKRRRRRQIRLALSCVGGLVLVALLVTLAVLVARGGEGETAADSTATTTASPSGLTATTSPSEAVAAADAAGAATTTSSTEPVSTTAAPQTTTTSASTTTTEPATTSTSTTSTTAKSSSGLVVVIDPGHQAQANLDLEPIGPGSSQQKAKVSSGTAGVVTGIPESRFNLTVGLKLRDSLAAHGITVVMTRTTQNVDISNIERAQIANQAGADLFVRIHADGNSNSAVNGIHVLYPASIAGWTDDIAAESKRAAVLAQNALIAATGATDRGIDARSDMTGFNWSDVPVIIPELGFMTNPTEDRLLATSAYQDKLVSALTQAILAFLGVS
jgi:N-acetylmuramoyl-L-alanine amidase